MIKPFLFNEPLLPAEFKFPKKYMDLIEDGLWMDLEPWSFLAASKPLSLSYYGDMLLKFPKVTLIPFAYISDISGLCNDGWEVLACFDSSSTQIEPCVIIYDYSCPENSLWDNFYYETFNDWVAAAQKESIQFKAERAKIESKD